MKNKALNLLNQASYSTMNKRLFGEYHIILALDGFGRWLSLLCNDWKKY